MARKEARIFTSIWNDPDFLALSAMAQRMYILALSQKELSFCGVLSYTARRWAKLAADTTVKAVERAVRELVRARFVVVDDDTEELWVRTFMKSDGLLKNPRMKAAIRNDFYAIHSSVIRQGVRDGGYDPLDDGGTGPGSDGGSHPHGDGGPDGGPDPSARARTRGRTAPTPPPTPTPPPPPETVAMGVPAGTSDARVAEDDDDPEIEAEVERRLQAVRASGRSVPYPEAWRAKARENLRAEIARDGRASVLAAPPPKPLDEAEKIAAASRARAKRNDARARGEACAACEGTGFVLGDDDVAVVCQQCSGAAAAIGQ